MKPSEEKNFLQKIVKAGEVFCNAMLCCIELLNCIQNLTVTKPQMEVSWIETRKSRTKSDRNGSNRQRGKIPYNAVVQQKVDSFVGQKIICLLISKCGEDLLYI